jgi:hypothetical protein
MLIASTESQALFRQAEKPKHQPKWMGPSNTELRIEIDNPQPTQTH